MRSFPRFSSLTAALLAAAALAPVVSGQEGSSERAPAKDARADKAGSRMAEVVSAGDSRITLKDRDGKEHRFDITDKTSLTLNGKPARLDDLKPGDRVQFTAGDAPNFTVVRGPDAQPAREGEPNRSDQNNSDSPAPERRRSLGVLLGPSPTTGARIHQVQPQSAAAAAGLQPGDFILSINDQKIARPEEVEQALAKIEADGEARLSIWRNGNTREFTAKFAQRREAGFRGTDGTANANDPNVPATREGQAVEARQRPFLGVILAERNLQPSAPPAEGTTPRPAGRQGVLASGIYKDGPADKAGIKSGDIITKVNGQDVARVRELTDALTELEPGAEVEFVVFRKDEEETIKATLADRAEYFRPEHGFDRNDSRGSFDDDSSSDDESSDFRSQLEFNRRLSQQNQRLEERLDQVIEELRALREEMSGKKTNRSDEGAKSNKE